VPHQLSLKCPQGRRVSLPTQGREEQGESWEHAQSNGQTSTGAIPDGQEASNAVPLSKRSADASSDSVDESQLLEEFSPDTPEPARGKNKHSKS